MRGMSNVGGPDAPGHDDLLRAVPVLPQRRLIPALVVLSVIASVAVGAGLLQWGADVASLVAGVTGLALLLATASLPGTPRHGA